MREAETDRPIAEVARMSGVTARTLRHYDEIGRILSEQVDEVEACAATTGGSSPNGTASTPWPTPSPARSSDWSGPGRTAPP